MEQTTEYVDNYFVMLFKSATVLPEISATRF